LSSAELVEKRGRSTRHDYRCLLPNMT